MDHEEEKLHVWGAKFYGKWTDATAGQCKYSSVQEEGMERFTVLCEMAKEGRTQKGHEVEQAFLTKLRAEKGITVWTHKERLAAKKRKSTQPAVIQKAAKSLEDAQKGFDGLFD